MRKSISTAFFSLVSTLMVLGIVLMGCSEWVLFKNYFARDRYETLDQVVGVTRRTAQYLAQQAALPEGDELDALNTKLEIIGESAEAYLFFTDNDGNVVLIASSPDMLTAHGRAGIEIRMNAKAAPASGRRRATTMCSVTLDGVLTEKSYITVGAAGATSAELARAAGSFCAPPAGSSPSSSSSSGPTSCCRPA